jgi:soluble lytic murein transglycosylase-like protein
MFSAILVLAGVGFAASLAAVLARKRAPLGRMIYYQPPPTPPPSQAVALAPSTGGAYVATTNIPKQFTPEIVASATKWARARGVPPEEILATIYVESRGKPHAWANKANEDSRGLMQINVRAWGSKLANYGMTEEDLWNVDKNIMVGSDIYAKYRRTVQDLIAQSGVPQSAPIDVLTRLYYKGPAYVKRKILAGKDASHPYRDAEKAVQNWKVAMTLANRVTSVA